MKVEWAWGNIRVTFSNPNEAVALLKNGRNENNQFLTYLFEQLQARLDEMEAEE